MACVAVLQPDGVFMATMLGGLTLSELRACMLLAEMEVRSMHTIGVRVSSLFKSSALCFSTTYTS